MDLPKGLVSAIVLNDGVSMPLFGLGVSKMKNVADIVSSALQTGYKLIDTAERYGNEAEVGRGIKQSGVRREDVFVVTKVYQHGRDYCRNALVKSLDSLVCSYVDLYLIHSPYDMNILETYDTMLEMKQEGLIRSVGVSNFGVQHLEGLAKAGRPAPSVNQIEVHPWSQKLDLVTYCRERGIQVMGYSPLCKGQRLDEPGLVEIATKHAKTPAQVALRWSVQHGYITIPKTSSEKRLLENANVFDFALTEGDIGVLNSFKSWECRLWSSDPTQFTWKK